RIGEGAAYLALERSADAAARSARRYGRIVGYGNAFEPPESEAALVHASQRAVERTIEMALADARLPATAIDVVCSSLAGVAAFDRAELAALERVLGDKAAVAAPKTLFGESFGASGAFGIASALAWLSGATPAPLVRGQAPASVSHVLVL